jgi:hypothetical protein
MNEKLAALLILIFCGLVGLALYYTTKSQTRFAAACTALGGTAHFPRGDRICIPAGGEIIIK